jgi:hypothetical protein
MLALFAALSIATSPIPEPATEPTITVSGEKLTEKQVHERARNYVRSVVPPNPPFMQFARWVHPVCLKVSGIADIYADIVATRMRNAAVTAGVPVSGPGCKTNLLVVFSPDAGETVEFIARKRPIQFQNLFPSDIDVLRARPLPVRWWHVLGMSGGLGGPAGQPSPAIAQSTLEGGRSVASLFGNVPFTSSPYGNLVESPIIVGATGAVAVVDIPLATGKPLEAVADYLAMVTLVQARLPPKTPDAPSIFSLFDGQPTTPELSTWDRTFLASFYKIPKNRPMQRQRARLAELIKASASPDSAQP